MTRQNLAGSCSWASKMRPASLPAHPGCWRSVHVLFQVHPVLDSAVTRLVGAHPVRASSDRDLPCPEFWTLAPHFFIPGRVKFYKHASEGDVNQDPRCMSAR